MAFESVFNLKNKVKQLVPILSKKDEAVFRRIDEEPATEMIEANNPPVESYEEVLRSMRLTINKIIKEKKS